MGLIPAVLIKSTMDDISKIVDNLAICEGDLVQFDSFTTEMQVWRGRWLGCKDAQDSLIASLNRCSRDLFPNLHVRLRNGCLISVTSCEAERSFSAVRRHKTTLRSTMSDERLTALVLMNTNYSFDIDVDRKW